MEEGFGVPTQRICWFCQSDWVTQVFCDLKGFPRKKHRKIRSIGRWHFFHLKKWCHVRKSNFFLFSGASFRCQNSYALYEYVFEQFDNIHILIFVVKRMARLDIYIHIPPSDSKGLCRKKEALTLAWGNRIHDSMRSESILSYWDSSIMDGSV